MSEARTYADHIRNFTTPSKVHVSHTSPGGRLCWLGSRTGDGQVGDPGRRTARESCRAPRRGDRPAALRRPGHWPGDKNPPRAPAQKDATVTRERPSTGPNDQQQGHRGDQRPATSGQRPAARDQRPVIRHKRPATSDRPQPPAAGHRGDQRPATRD